VCCDIQEKEEEEKEKKHRPLMRPARRAFCVLVGVLHRGGVLTKEYEERGTKSPGTINYIRGMVAQHQNTIFICIDVEISARGVRGRGIIFPSRRIPSAIWRDLGLDTQQCSSNYLLYLSALVSIYNQPRAFTRAAPRLEYFRERWTSLERRTLIFEVGECFTIQ